jgi:2',3'-cyclic-nucleotide 2'-phosphodiesterase (5'-nucleotidase family)
MSAQRGPQLRIISVNDVYSLENLPRLRSLVRHHAETDPADAMIVVLAGDFLAPSLLSSLDDGRGMVECLDAVGVTHVVLGNHEDDLAPSDLAARLRELRATCLATNVVGFELPLPTSDVVEVSRPSGRAVRVGLVGVVIDEDTVYTRRPFGDARVEPANDAARREAQRLREESGCAVVVPITHQTMAADRALAAEQRDPPFPVIVGGHEHRGVVEEAISGTWIVKADAEAAHAIVTDVLFSIDPPAPGAFDAPMVSVRVEDVGLYEEDPEVRALVESHMVRVRALERAPLVILGPGEELSSVGTRVRQTSMGTFVCNTARDAMGAEACLFNGGGIRGGRAYRERLTYGDIEVEVPFPNELVVARIPGRVVAEAVKASRSRAPIESGAFLQVDDRMTIDPTTGAVTAIDGAPLDADREYRVALVRELFEGLDQIEPLVRYAREHPSRIPPAGSGREVKLVLVQAFSVALFKKLGAFESLDEDGDGYVSRAELHAAVGRVMAEHASPLTVSLVMRAVDTDGDDLISPSEARAAAADEPAAPDDP